ncbi:MAG: hypothetical protein GF417_07945 [Candidatus Latescibacteria bacterium]|nr:hypothetical protein [bacterium]MBD3424352.1 hypothetical protein [Candidatus Latescibacterota bacterium]
MPDVRCRERPSTGITDMSFYSRNMPGFVFSALFMVLLAAPGLELMAQDKDEPEAVLGVVFSEGRRTVDVDLSRADDKSSEFYITAYDLARIFKATKYWKPGARKLVLRIGSKDYLFTIDTRVVVVNGEPVLMRVPARYVDGAVMIPLEFVGGVLSRESAERIELDGDNLVLTIGTPEYNVTGLRFEKVNGRTSAVLTLTDELLYHVDTDTPGLLRLKIYGGRLNTLKMSAVDGKGLFRRVRAEQTEYDAYLFFQVEQSASGFRVEFTDPEEGDHEQNLVIYLEKGELPEIPDADFAGRKMVEIFEPGSMAERGFEIEKIMIDPGHGGTDGGRVSSSGVQEKDINLDIARELKGMLVERLGVEVLMTREDDQFLTLTERGEIANIEEADIFISIHCNGWFHPEAGGFETYFLAPARTEEERRQAREENSAVELEDAEMDPEKLEELDFIIWDMVQNEFIAESSELAETVQKELAEVLTIRNRGVKQAGFKVLRGINMPAILIEVAFLSNRSEEKLLQDQSFQSSVCAGIVEAVRKFSSGKIAADAGAPGTGY